MRPGRYHRWRRHVVESFAFVLMAIAALGLVWALEAARRVGP